MFRDFQNPKHPRAAPEPKHLRRLQNPDGSLKNSKALQSLDPRHSQTPLNPELYPTPQTLHPTPYTLYPAPYTLSKPNLPVREALADSEALAKSLERPEVGARLGMLGGRG